MILCKKNVLKSLIRQKNAIKVLLLRPFDFAPFDHVLWKFFWLNGARHSKNISHKRNNAFFVFWITRRLGLRRRINCNKILNTSRTAKRPNTTTDTRSTPSSKMMSNHIRFPKTKGKKDLLEPFRMS